MTDRLHPGSSLGYRPPALVCEGAPQRVSEEPRPLAAAQPQELLVFLPLLAPASGYPTPSPRAVVLPACAEEGTVPSCGGGASAVILLAMEASRPLGSDRQQLTPEEETVLARREARNSRRWAYFALLLGLIAAVAAGIALAFLLSEAEQSRASASRESVRELQDDVRRLNEQSEAARSARSEADTADDRSRSLREQVDDLERQVGEANDRADATQRQVAELNDELSDDIQQLREDVERAAR